MTSFDQVFNITTATEDIITLHNEGEKLYLGGSRRMAKRQSEELHATTSLAPVAAMIRVTDETDWDYYATFTPKLQTKLIDMGWSQTDTNPEYFDSECVEIFKKDNSQIVLRCDAEFYKKVFENIPLWFYTNFMWKSSPNIQDPMMIQPMLEVLFLFARNDFTSSKNTV